MVELYGEEYTPAALRRRIGSMRQLAGVRSSTLNDGMEAGVRALDFTTGSGLQFSVLPDRGMDIGDLRWCGVPLVWHSSTGPQHPAFYEAEGMGWLRGFYGGGMVTCGFMNVAVPSEDRGEFYGLHGRASYLRASNVAYDAYWDGEEYLLEARGKVRESRVFGENVLLRRIIRSKLGSNEIEIVDVVENQGFEETPFMILYHINAGFPVLSENSELLINSEITPRDSEARKGEQVAREGAAPAPGFKEQVHQHHVTAGEDGYAVAALVNPAFGNGQGIGLAVRYRPEELPYFWQWRMVGEGTYVMGMEPANCHVMGRGVEREKGRLPVLAPGERRTHYLSLRALTSLDEIDAIAQEIGSA